MKQLLTCILLLNSSLVFAHPAESDNLAYIGEGTKIAFGADLNIPGGKSWVHLTDPGEWVTSHGSGVGRQCFLQFEPAARDRRLPAGREVTIEKIIYSPFESESFSSGDYVLELSGVNGVKEILCQTSTYKLSAESPEYSHIAIGEFSSLLKRVGAAIKFAKPVDL